MVMKELGGVVVPVITPVDNQDRVDELTFRKVIQFLVDSKVHAIFCGGSAGEGPLLTQKEWVRMVEIAYGEGKGKVHLLGGAIDTSTARVVERIKILTRIGYSNIVVTPTFYVAARSVDEHLRLYEAAKDACGDRELIAYNIPSCTNSEIEVETMCEMARRGWVKYCKESSGNMDYFKKLVIAGKEFGLKVFMGDEGGIAEGLLAGACGIVPVCANYEPKTFIRAYEAAQRGDAGEVRRLQSRVTYLRQRLPLGGLCWVAGVKYAVATLGIGSGKPVSPLQPLSAEQQKIINEITPYNPGGC